MRSFYSSEITDFLQMPASEILGSILKNSSSAEVKIQQENAWEREIAILKAELSNFKEGRIIFEYTIPRMGHRADVVILHRNIVFILEFKVGDDEYRNSAYEQALGYALDLRDFQEESRNRVLAPMVIATKAPAVKNEIIKHQNIILPLFCNAHTISETINEVATHEEHGTNAFDYLQWEQAKYLPTPTIVEAAQALYQGHNVQDITRSDASAKNLTETTDEINRIIEQSKQDNKKSIIFVTGVPGAGKTLVGLNLAIQHAHASKGEHAVFLSGNYPLVKVLQEALARDSKSGGTSKTISEARRKTKAFIQIIHKYRDDFVDNDRVPPEKITIFDEAQRAWTKEAISKFMKTKKGVIDFDYSEPEFLISTMDRHKDWAVVVCLVGGGQEINAGEAGLPEWFDALRRHFSDWEIFIAPELNDEEYRMNRSWNEMTRRLNIHERPALHLATSMRSFRTPYLSALVKAILDVDIEKAKNYYAKIKGKYPIKVTRNLNDARKWIRNQCIGPTRYGIVSSSGGRRLKAEGVFVKNKIDVAEWFLDEKGDVRSSYQLEDTATEFDVQGLELDYSLVCWDANFRFENNHWGYYNFMGARWTRVGQEYRKMYLKNSYRVLLTRARQGMVIFVPKGSNEDKTRLPEFYDGVYEYLRSIGIEELSGNSG